MQRFENKISLIKIISIFSDFPEGDCWSSGTINVKTDGTCTCKANFVGSMCDQCEMGYSGPNCDQCDEGYHKYQKSCIVGECSARGTQMQETDGTCQCKKGFGGDTCNHCRSGFHMHNNECLSGGCDPIGTIEREDNKCICINGYIGLQCENCDAKYIRDNNNLCKSKYLWIVFSNSQLQFCIFRGYLCQSWDFEKTGKWSLFL